MTNIPIKHSKTVLPTSKVVLHGIEADSVAQTIKLPRDKLSVLRAKLIAMSKRKKASLREVQSLVGSLQFSCRVISPGRTFCRRLINLTLGKSNPNHLIRLNSKARKDIKAWLEFLENINGTMSFLPVVWTSSDVLHLTTDASGFAFGAVFGNEWLQGSFPVNWSAVHNSVKELLPIILVVHCWGSTFTNRRILFLSDNSAVVDVINQQTARDVSLMDLIRELVVVCMSRNICFRAKYIPGKTNVVPDHISRLQEGRARVVQPTRCHFVHIGCLGEASIATIDRANTTRTRTRYRSNWQHFVNFFRHLKEGKQQFIRASP